MSGNKQPFDAEQFRQECYKAYQLDWMRSHGFDVFGLLSSMWDFLQSCYDSDTPILKETNAEELYADWCEDCGFGGSIWACYDEFLDAEYQDVLYMHSILTPDQFVLYARDRNEG